MHAVVIEDGQLHWRERPDPAVGEHDLLVAVRAAGVNGADLLQRQGQYPPPPGWPADVPGLETAGEVVAVGSRVTRFAPGDRVIALLGGGGQATRAAVDEEYAVAVPAGLSWPEAGGFMESCATAYDALFRQAGLTLGERVLVTGAAGGVGSAAVQLAVSAGAHVVAAVRDPARYDAVASLGVAVVVEPAGVAAHGPYDVVLELVGAASLPAALEALAVWGRIVVIGVGSGSKLEIDLLQLMGRRARLFASTLRARTRAEKAAVVADIGARVVPLLADGRLRIPVLATYPMSEATDAYERFAGGRKFGKIVLVV